MSEQARVKTRMGVYAIVPLWLVLHPDVKDFAVRLFVYLVARHADREDGTCHPKRRTIAAALGVTEKTIDRAFGQLKKAGALTIDNRHDESGQLISSLYTMIFDNPEGGGRVKNVPTPVGTNLTLRRVKNVSSILVRTNNQLTRGEHKALAGLQATERTTKSSRKALAGLQAQGRACPHDPLCRSYLECRDRILRDGRETTH